MRKAAAVAGAWGLLAAACSFTAPTVRLTAPSSGAPGPHIAGSAIHDASIEGDRPAGGALVRSSPATRQVSCKDGAPGVTARSVKIGASVAISGPLQSLTSPAVKSMKAYFNALNAKGGVHGRTIEFVYIDDGWDAQRGRINIKRLVAGDRVLALTASSSNGIDAATRYLEEQRVPVLGMSGALSSQFRSPVIFPVGIPSDASARITIQDAALRLKAKTLAVMWVDVASGVEVRQSLNRSLAQIAPQMSLVADRRISLGEPTLEPVWNDIQNQTRNWQRSRGRTADGRPDFVLLAVDPSNGIKALQAAERLGFRPKIGWGGPPTLFLDLVLANTDLAAKSGLYSSSPFIPPIREFEHLPAVREYLSGIRAYVDERDLTNPVVELGWIAAALTVRALQDAGPCPTRDLVLAAADRITAWQAAGLTLPLTFRPLGEGAGRDANPWSMIVQAVPRGQHGCARAIGCWRWIKAATPNGWYQDPLLVRGSA